MADSRILLEQKKSVEPPSHKRKIQVAAPIPAPIIRQAKVAAHMQAAYLDAKSLASVSAACHGANALFSEPLAKRALQRLLHHVAYGEQNQAEAMIRRQPKLLLQADTVIDPASRTLRHVTPITAAYGADDVDMLEMMFKYLDKPSKDNAIHQIKEKFPEEKESKSYDFSLLVAAITANENVEAALEQFRKDFTPGVIEKGKHFNMKTLLAAYQAYNDNWEPWSGEQCSLFFRQVIGYLQRSLPACYAQAFCQGLYHVTEGGKPLQRGLTLDGGVPFYPPNLKLKEGLGFDFGASPHGPGAPLAYRTMGLGDCAPSLKIYVEQKHQRCEILCNGKTFEQNRCAR